MAGSADMKEEKNAYHLTRVHEANLKILKEVDRICRKHGIQYLMDAGTLLGAVRHKGFIPWDDDADLAFTRDNYDKFIKVVRDELPEGMTFFDCTTLRGGRAFYDFTCRILYDNSRTHEDTPEMQYYEGVLNHLWVDLFVIDELPENKLSAAFTLFLHKAVYGMAMGHRYQLDYSSYTPLYKLFVGVLATVGKLVPMKTIFKMQHMLSVKDKKGTSNLRYYSNYQPDYLYVTLQKQWCEEIVDLEFEDTALMAPKEWHQVLTWIYGDYNQLPPEEKRVPSHSSMEIEIYG